MSDFTSEFWAWYAAGLTLVSILACLVLLWISGTTKVKASADNTTGHVWDGDLREMNNPLPRWWVGLFLITIVFSLGYLALYPGLGTNAGQFAWTSTGQYDAEVAKANKELEPLYAKFAGMPPEDVAKDPQAMAIGDRLFMNNCAQCHGSDARGSKGFPNLTDNDWLYGGTPDKIKETLLHGRKAAMPGWFDALGEQGIKEMTAYVLSLSGRSVNERDAEAGKTKFALCAACHGPDGKGSLAHNLPFGAPNLTDNIWLYGGSARAVEETLTKGRNGVMPAFKQTLGEDKVHILTAYVYRLANPEKPAEQQ